MESINSNVVLNQKILSSFTDKYKLKDVLSESMNKLYPFYGNNCEYILYGSYAKMNPHIDSDIDIAIIGRELEEPNIEYGFAELTTQIMDEFDQVMVHFMIYDKKLETYDIKKNILSGDYYFINTDEYGDFISLEQREFTFR